MPTPAKDFASSTRRAQDRAETRRVAAELPSSYWIDVHCTQVADIVQYAGGWLFDHVMAGWQVTVNVDANQDLKPLQILGIRPQSLVRDGEDVHTEVLVWGERGADDGEGTHGLCTARYPLSIAARAFKAHALRAADIQMEADHAVEFFCTSLQDAAARRGCSEDVGLVVLQMTGREHDR